MRRETYRHTWARGSGRLVIVAVTLFLLGAPAGASASNPAQDQYKLPTPSATGGAGGNGGGRLDPAATTSGSGSDTATVAILAGGLAAICAAAAVIVYRRRRTSETS